MNREFMELYNRELALFYEHAAEFAEEYPGVAERLGAMTQDNPDPMVGALLEGAAFLATRVQLKLKHEFSTFTDNLLEQLVPNFLAPIPSVLRAQVVPEFGDEALRDGMILPRGSYIDAAYRERDRSIACRYRLASEIAVFPLSLVRAEYIAAVAPLEALGLTVPREGLAGLRLGFRVRSTRNLEAEPPPEQTADKPSTWAKGLKIRGADGAPGRAGGRGGRGLRADLRPHRADRAALAGPRPEMAHAGRCRARRSSRSASARTRRCYPVDHRVFRGFDYIRDYFTFPQAFLGFRLRDFGRYLDDIASPIFELIFVFDDVSPRLGSGHRHQELRACSARPPSTSSRRPATASFSRPNEYEYQVVPERTRYLDFEPHRVLSVAAHRSGQSERIPVYPLYSSPEDQAAQSTALFYSIRRMQRRRTGDENKYGLRSDYIGTDMFLTLVGHERAAERGEEIAELSVRALCSNRHLPEHLPVGETGADFIYPRQRPDQDPRRRPADAPARAADQRHLRPVAAELHGRERLAPDQHVRAEPSGPGRDPRRQGRPRRSRTCCRCSPTSRTTSWSAASAASARSTAGRSPGASGR